MTKMPYARLYVLLLFLVVVTGAVSFGLDPSGKASVAALVAAYVAMTVLGAIPIVRWWLGVARRAGPIGTERTRTQTAYGLAAVATMVGGVGLTYGSFALTGSRLAEAAAALLVVLPLVAYCFLRSDAVTPPPAPKDASRLRINVASQLMLFVIFAANAALRIAHPNRYPDLQTMDNFVTATFFVVIPLMPLNVYMLERRYRRAVKSQIAV